MRTSYFSPKSSASRESGPWIFPRSVTLLVRVWVCFEQLSASMLPSYIQTRHPIQSTSRVQFMPSWNPSLARLRSSSLQGAIAKRLQRRSLPSRPGMSRSSRLWSSSHSLSLQEKRTQCATCHCRLHQLEDRSTTTAESTSSRWRTILRIPLQAFKSQQILVSMSSMLPSSRSSTWCGRRHGNAT